MNAPEDGKSLKVWWVLAGAEYYPSWDNFVASFETEQEADAAAKEYRRRNQWTDVINIEDRL